MDWTETDNIPQDPRDIEIILSSHVHIDKSEEYRFFEPWIGHGLLTSTGHTWKLHRKLIAPTFHLDVLKSFVPIFNTNSNVVVQNLRQENGQTFDVHGYMSECTVETLLDSVMNVGRNFENKPGKEYTAAVMKMCDIIYRRPSKIWLRPDWLFKLTRYGKEQVKLLKIIHNFSKNILMKKKDDLMKKCKSVSLKDDDDNVGQKKRVAFLDLMMELAENGAQISEQQIKDEFDTMMFAGRDTTAAALSFFLTSMGCHPHIQNQVIEELDLIFGDSNLPVTYAHTTEMKYLERCIMETLRLYPPVPIIARKVKQDLKLASGEYTLPAGCTVVIGTLKLHRNNEIYPNADVFDPDNFLPEKMADRHHYSYIPFSLGPRSCVGRKYALLKLKILLSTILRNFKVISEIPEKDFMVQGDIILKRVDGFPIRLEPRKSIFVD